VLNPKHDLLAGLGRGQAGVKIRWPGIGVVGAGQILRSFAEDVERVLDDIMAGSAYRMYEELPRELTQLETPPDLPAVDDDAGRPRRQGLPPFGQDGAPLVEKA